MNEPDILSVVFIDGFRWDEWRWFAGLDSRLVHSADPKGIEKRNGLSAEIGGVIECNAIAERSKRPS
jgi:hypothetical protein